MNNVCAIRSPRFSDEEGAGVLIGKAPAFQEVVSKLPAVAQAQGAVLITGETGTGKELVARAVHDLSARASGPFVPLNCGALVDTLLESELFGHERGAFTDAHARRQGLIAQAAGGTLFLDELETLTARAQVALLRLLQDRCFRMVGSPMEQQVDVRFVTATNAPLQTLVQSGGFRADLYYRVSVFSIRLPPLRERREDILPLAEHFIWKYGDDGTTVPQLSAGAVEALLAWDWPGNVRELESAIVRALPVTTNGCIEPGDLGLPEACGETGPRAFPPAPGTSYKSQKRRIVEAFERHYLVRLMTESQGNVSRAALEAGKERRDLGKLLKRHGINPRQFVARGESLGAGADRTRARCLTCS